MAFSFGRLFNGKNPFYERLKNSTHRYIYSDDNPTWDSLSDKLKCGYENPAFTSNLQLISFYVSQVEFKLKNKKTVEIKTEHPIIDIFNNPNIYQSKQDFLAQLIWLKKCLGYTYIYLILPVGFKEADDIQALFNLNTWLVTFPNNFQTRFVFNDDEISNLSETLFKYDIEGQNLNISIKDIIPFYDLPNGLISSNMFISPSILDELKKTLNISRAFDAKDIAVKSNRK